MRQVTLLKLMLSSLFLLPLPVLAQEVIEEIVPPDRLKIISTANVGGLASAYHYEIQQPYLLSSAFIQHYGESLGLQGFKVGDSALPFYAQHNYLWAPGFGVHQLRSFLANPPVPEQIEQVVVLQSSDSLMVEVPSTGDEKLTPMMEAWLRREPSLRENIRLPRAELIRYPGPVYRLKLQQASEKLLTNPLEWEMLLGFQLKFSGEAQHSHQFMVVGQPEGEGSRRVQQLRKAQGPDDLLIDSGNLLEGLSSVETNRLSLQRSNSLKLAQSLGYDAMNIGKNELLGGLENLLAEQQQYQLPLISASLRRQGQYVFSPYKLINVGQIRLALIGLADPLNFEELQLNGVLPADLEILPPAQALNQAMQALHEHESVDLVAVLSDLDARELTALGNVQQDVQLIFAGSDSPLQHLKQSLLLDGHKPLRPFVIDSHVSAISQLELESAGEGLKISSELLPVRFDSKPDRDALPEIMAIRQKAYEDALDPLLPDLGPLIRQNPRLLEIFLQSASTREARRRLGSLSSLQNLSANQPEKFLNFFPPYLTAELLANLEMNGLLEAFDAEGMALRLDADSELAIPGPQSRLLIYERLKTSDTLERYYLNGDQLKKLLDLKLPGLVFGGMNPANKQLWGRDIGDRRNVYRILLPSSLSSHSALRGLLKGVRHDSLLNSPYDQSPEAVRVYLRDAVLGMLEALQNQPDAQLQMAQLSQLLQNNWQERKLIFSIQLDNLQLNLSGYRAINNQSYTEVRETRVTSPNSVTFGGRTRLALGLDNQWLGWTNGATAKYEGFMNLDSAVAKDRLSENQDDLVFNSELQLRLLEFKLFDTPLPLTPFLEGIFDTEFTPTLNATTQALNPRQAELRGVLGLAIPPGDQLKSFKAGLALRRDLNVPNNLEAGLDFKFLHDLPLTSFLSWNNDLNLRYFFPTPNDNASSLGLIGQYVSALKFSLTENLFLRFYADAYLFQGKLPSTSQLGASVIFGVGLGYDRIWKPWFEPVF